MSRYVLGVDLGGTQIRACLADLHGVLVRQAQQATLAGEGPEKVVERIKQSARQVLADVTTRELLAAGIASPGPLDPFTGIIIAPPNLPGWDHVPLREIMVREFGVPVWINNDANLACLAEHQQGAGRSARDVVYLTISTGIGGGVICNGKLLLGAHGLASEPGHMTVDPSGPRCHCGAIGCLESFSSGTAIARQARQWIGEGRESLLGRPPHAKDELTAERVADAARSGDRLAQEVVGRAAHYLGIGVCNLIHIFDPDKVILGGGVSKLGALLFEPVRLWVRENALTRTQGETPIVPAQLGDEVGLYGAVVWALQNV